MSTFVTTFAHNCCYKNQARNKRICLEHGAKKVFDFSIDTLDAPNNIKEYIKNTPKGAGHFCWKPLTLQNVFNSPEVKENDIIMYMDSSMWPTNPPNCFNALIEDINNNNIFVFKVPFSQRDWSKMNAVRLFTNNENWFEEQGQDWQLMATFVGIVNNDIGRSFVNGWANLMEPNKCHYYDDSPSPVPNWIDFQESRWDQTMMSLYLYKNHPEIVKNFRFPDFYNEMCDLESHRPDWLKFHQDTPDYENIEDNITHRHE